MRVIGVVDLLGGRAVHAREGRRTEYVAVRQAAGARIDGDADSLARTYIGLGVDALYVADLDAITRGQPPSATIGSLAALDVPLWLDAGVTSADAARAAAATGASPIIVALETLDAFAALDDICRAIGAPLTAFSLDLLDGEAITRLPHGGVDAIARRAADAGVSAITVIDLARVGAGRGPDLTLIAQVRNAVPGLTLIAGGGVRGADDLSRLADAGCDGVLVASALHDGRLTARDVAAAREGQRNASR